MCRACSAPLVTLVSGLISLGPLLIGVARARVALGSHVLWSLAITSVATRSTSRAVMVLQVGRSRALVSGMGLGSGVGLENSAFRLRSGSVHVAIIGHDGRCRCGRAHGGGGRARPVPDYTRWLQTRVLAGKTASSRCWPGPAPVGWCARPQVGERCLLARWLSMAAHRRDVRGSVCVVGRQR